LLLCVEYLDQEIEFSGAESLRIREGSNGEWRSFPTDLQAVVELEFLNVRLPVLTKDKLIEYKRMAGREVDVVDIKALESLPKLDAS
jgi:hypothetical protein